VVVALVCTSLGAGIVAIPHGLCLAGYVGISLMLLVACLNGLSLHCLFRSALVDRSCASYHALAQRHLPAQVSLLIEGAIGLLLLGAACTTFLLSTHVLTSAQAAAGRAILGEDALSLSLSLAILPVCLAKKFAALQWVNMLNLSCCVGASVLICISCWQLMDEEVSVTQASLLGRARGQGFSAGTSLSGALAATPLMFYIFFNQINAPHLFSELRSQDRPNASIAAGAATLICVLLYGIVGLLGYACFGQATQADILVQLVQHGADWRLCLAQALFGTLLLCSMPLITTPLRDMIMIRLAATWRGKEEAYELHFAVTTSIIFISAIVARLVPHVDLLMGIMGATSVAFLALTVPGALALRCLPGVADRAAGVVLVCSGLVATPLFLGALVAEHM